MHNCRREAKSLFIAAWLLLPSVACDGAGDGWNSGERHATRHSDITGTAAVEEITNSAAASAVIKTVGRVFLTSEQGFPMPRCVGTLVGRDKVVTSKSCTLERTDPAGISVAFGTSQMFGVSSVWEESASAGQDGIVVLTLVQPVPESTVNAVAPAFVGNVTELIDSINSGDNVSPPPLIAGFGAHCPGADGPAAVTQSIRFAHYHQPLGVFALSASDPATAWTMIGGGVDTSEVALHCTGDFGGPLFVFHKASRRYVLAGVYHGPIASARGFAGHSWSYLGDPGNGGVDLGPAVIAALDLDRDADGVPDSSDNCDPNRCRQQGFAFADCANPSQKDSDANGIGDACCFLETWKLENSNGAAEHHLNSGRRPDECDPVPLLRIAKRNPTGIGVFKPDADLVSIGGDTWIGYGASLESFSERVAFRYCACVRQDGSLLDEAACVEQCGAGNAVPALGGFTPIDVTWERQPWDLVNISGEMGLPQNFHESRRGSRLNFTWNARRAADEDLIETGSNAALQGLIASAVLVDGTQYYSGVDSATQGRLRADLIFKSIPSQAGVGIAPFKPPYIAESRCLADPFGCFSAFVMPGDLWLREVTGVPDLISEPMLVQIDPSSGLPFGAVWWDASYRVDFGDKLEDGLAWTYPDAVAPWPWIAPIEPHALLLERKIDYRAVRIASSTHDLSGVALIRADEEGLRVDFGASAAIASNQLSASAAELRVLVGSKAVFSATTDALFLVGGSALAPTERIRRYNVARRELDLVEVEPAYAPWSVVLGATVDFTGGKLFVLDTDGKDVRLLEYDLTKGESRVLLRDSYKHQWDSLFLGHLENNSLVLVASKAGSYRACSIDVAGDRAEFTGRLDGSVNPIAVPVMGEYGLWMPVVDEQRGIRYESLAADRFTGGESCRDSL